MRKKEYNVQVVVSFSIEYFFRIKKANTVREVQLFNQSKQNIFVFMLKNKVPKMNIKISFNWIMLVIVHAKPFDYVFSLKQSPDPAIIGSKLTIALTTTFSMVSCTWIKIGYHCHFYVASNSPTQRNNLASLCYFWHNNMSKLTTSRNVQHADIYVNCLEQLILL